MFSHVVAWIKEKVMVVGGLVVIFSGIYWAAVVAVKSFSGSRVLYRWDSAELWPLLLIGAVLLWSLCYQIAECAYSRMPATSVILAIVAPWVFVIAVTSLICWIATGPAKEASYLPLTALAMLAGVGSYAVWYGPLSDRGRLFRQRATHHRGANEDSTGAVAIAQIPKVRFSDVHGNAQLKTRLTEAAKAIITSQTHGGQSAARNGILLHGLPGNGKTYIAEALAGELHLPLLQLSIGEVSSKWVGEKTERVRKAFLQAQKCQPCVLFIDEVDSLLEARDGGRGDGVKEDRDVVNALLTLLVDIRKARVIVVAATNHIDRLDAAGIREGRFDFKIEISPPDESARIGILADGMRKHLPHINVEADLIRVVAKRWNGFSVKRIQAVSEEMPSYLNGRIAVSFEDFMGTLRRLQGQGGVVVGEAKHLRELVLNEDTREALDLLVRRLSDPEYTEKNGGALPTGVLFFGPPGTGKTATCKALAKACNWAFLPVNGADLARSPRDLDRLLAKAKDLRPTIIFVDEADDLLRARGYSSNSDATNKLLTLMDGAEDRVVDVVWIAATNHPDQIDQALLRAGRFTEKVSFHLPTTLQVSEHLRAWLDQRRIALASGNSVEALAETLGEISIANAEGIVQSAVNRAVARREIPVVLTADDLQHGIRSTIGS